MAIPVLTEPADVDGEEDGEEEPDGEPDGEADGDDEEDEDGEGEPEGEDEPDGDGSGLDLQPDSSAAMSSVATRKANDFFMSTILYNSLYLQETSTLKIS
jgi:hypothetical protein